MGLVGRKPPEDGTRKIVIALPDGLLYDMTLLEFVCFEAKCALSYLNPDVPWEEIGGEMIAPYTAIAATELCDQGWFTAEEWIAAWSVMEAEDLLDELKEVLGGNDVPPRPEGRGTDAEGG